MENDLRRQLVHMAIILLVATASFGAGILVKVGKSAVPVRIDYFSQPAVAAFSAENAPEAAQAAAVAPSSGAVVASKKGTKYHAPWCPGAATISPENKIYFEAPEAARAAGYQPAANCKGLK